MDEEFKFIIGGPSEFSFSEMNFKGEKQYYVTGYISTKDLDLVDDIVTEDCLKDMVSQINQGNIKLDAEHEAWRNGEDGTKITPVGRIIEAKYDSDGERVWVKALINKNSTRFKSVWGNIKDKFLDAFSIAFKPITTVVKMVGDKQIRLLEKVQLLNVALTGNPANPEARITNVFAKSLNHMEEQNMTEEKPKEDTIVEEKVEETKKEEVVEEKTTPEFDAALKTLNDTLEKQGADFKEQLKELQKELGDSAAEVKSLKKKLEKPQFKALAEQAPKPKTVKAEEKDFSPMSLV